MVSAIAKAAREYGNPFERPDALKRVPRTVDSFLKEYHSGAFDIVGQAEDVVRAGIRQLRGKPQHSIGAGDAIHLVSALKLSAEQRRRLVFVTADRGLYDAAREHGLAVYNPNTEHEERLEALAGL